MSTTAARRAGTVEAGRRADAPAPAPGGRPGIPMSRLVHVELRKLVDTRSGRWMLITIGLVTAGALALVLFFSTRSDLIFPTFLGATAMPQLLLLPVLGILTATAEFSQRTGLVTWTQEPRRLRVVAAKLVAASAAAVLAYALAVGLAALANVAGMSLKDGAGTWDWSWAAVGGGLLAAWLGVVQGVAFGLLVVVPGAAIAAFFLLPTVMSLLTNAVPRLHDAAPWIDMSQSTAVLLEGRMTRTDWAHLASSYGLWALLPLVLGAWLLTRREIK